MLSYKRYDIYRTSTTLVDGEYEPSLALYGSVRGSLQPVGAKESKGLPDEFRAKAKYKLYTRNESLRVNGTWDSAGPVVGDNIDTPLGVLKIVGVEQHYSEVVDRRLRRVAHGKYYLNGGDGAPN